MKSKWYELKPKAIALRQRGLSIRHIEVVLAIPRSTLSGWFRHVLLTVAQRKKLHEEWRKGLHKARAKAATWHRTQKSLRFDRAKAEAKATLARMPLHNSAVLDLALAMLYLGEGFKKSRNTCMGNSDPLILCLFIEVLKSTYGVSVEDIKCALHLRADQSPERMKKFWSQALGIPEKNFTKASIDARTQGSPTYSHYKGVCVVGCGHVAIQRKLTYLATLFCENTIRLLRARSSVG